MSSIMIIDFTDDAWTQASLPFCSGGLGIQKAVDIALLCYISSALSAHSVVEDILSSVTDLASFEMSAEIETWKASGPGLIEPNGEACFRQKAWDTPHIDFIQGTLLENADQFSRARLLASAQPESGAWASAIPVPNLGTQLSPAELRITFALRIGP